MNEIITIPELENNSWPSEFSGAWMNKFINNQNRICFGLYFNNKYPEGFILENEQEQELPHAYIVIMQDGSISDIYVKKQYRHQKVATMLCGWARSHLLNDGIIVHAPEFMSDSARNLYEYISDTYGEPFIQPTGVPFLIVYTDFNGGMDAFYVENN